MMTMPEHRWLWHADLVRVIDGDTVDVEISVGFHADRTERLRLLGVNAPEMHGTSKEAGQKALDWLEAALWFGTGDQVWPLLIETQKTDAFGRYLATIWRKSDGLCINDALLAAGHAVEYVR